MDQCEDREEGVPPSKSTLCGEHESQTKAQRNPPGPDAEPEIHTKSQSGKEAELGSSHDQSTDDMTDFKELQDSAAERSDERPAGPEPGDQNGVVHGDEAKSAPDTSFGSLKNDGPETDPSDCKGQQDYAAERNPPGPPPSCVSCKSDWSKEEPINFKVQPVSAAERYCTLKD